MKNLVEQFMEDNDIKIGEEIVLIDNLRGHILENPYKFDWEHQLRNKSHRRANVILLDLLGGKISFKKNLSIFDDIQYLINKYYCNNVSTYKKPKVYVGKDEFKKMNESLIGSYDINADFYCFGLEVFKIDTTSFLAVGNLEMEEN